MKGRKSSTKSAQAAVALRGFFERGAMGRAYLPDDPGAMASIDKDIAVMELTAGAAAALFSAAAFESL
jgi:hypothetical protein